MNLSRTKENNQYVLLSSCREKDTSMSTCDFAIIAALLHNVLIGLFISSKILLFLKTNALLKKKTI